MRPRAIHDEEPGTPTRHRDAGSDFAHFMRNRVTSVTSVTIPSPARCDGETGAALAAHHSGAPTTATR